MIQPLNHAAPVTSGSSLCFCLAVCVERGTELSESQGQCRESETNLPLMDLYRAFFLPLVSTGVHPALTMCSSSSRYCCCCCQPALSHTSSCTAYGLMLLYVSFAGHRPMWVAADAHKPPLSTLFEWVDDPRSVPNPCQKTTAVLEQSKDTTI